MQGHVDAQMEELVLNPPRDAMGAGEVFEEAAAEEAGENLGAGEPDAAPRLPPAALDIEARVGHPPARAPGTQSKGAQSSRSYLPETRAKALESDT